MAWSPFVTSVVEQDGSGKARAEIYLWDASRVRATNLSTSGREGRRGVAGLSRGRRAGGAPGLAIGTPALLEGGGVPRCAGPQNEPEHDAQDQDDRDVDEV